VYKHKWFFFTKKRSCYRLIVSGSLENSHMSLSLPAIDGVPCTLQYKSIQLWMEPYLYTVRVCVSF
jgi:hypothetical protein